MADGVVIYIGAGDYLAGVPARDMTIDEWEALDQSDRDAALALDLYQVPKTGHVGHRTHKAEPAPAEPAVTEKE